MKIPPSFESSTLRFGIRIPPRCHGEPMTNEGDHGGHGDTYRCRCGFTTAVCWGDCREEVFA